MSPEEHTQGWLRSLEDRVNPKNGALLVLDMLKGSPDAPPSLSISRIRDPLRHLIELIDSGRKVGLPIIYVKNSHGDWTSLENIKAARSGRSASDSARYIEGTRGVEFHDGLEPQEGEGILVKHSYSPFAHGPLDFMLRSRGLKGVLLTGGGVMGAVEAAAKECFVRGYYLVLVSDCMVPISGPDNDIVLRHCSERLGAIVASTAEIIDAWRITQAKRE